MRQDHRQRAAFLFAGQQVIADRKNEDRQQKNHHKGDIERAGHEVHRVLQFVVLGDVHGGIHRHRNVTELNVALAHRKRRQPGGRQAQIFRGGGAHNAGVGALRRPGARSVRRRCELVFAAFGQNPRLILLGVRPHLRTASVLERGGRPSALDLAVDGALARPGGEGDGPGHQQQQRAEGAGAKELPGLV